MPVLKCSMCGGDLQVNDVTHITTCAHCGLSMTIAKNDEPKVNVTNNITQVSNSIVSSSLLDRAFICIEDMDFNKADQLLEQVLNIEPRSARAYIGKLLCELQLTSEKELEYSPIPLSKSNNFNRAIEFADEDYKLILEQYEQAAAKIAEEEKIKTQKIELQERLFETLKAEVETRKINRIKKYNNISLFVFVLIIALFAITTNSNAADAHIVSACVGAIIAGPIAGIIAGITLLYSENDTGFIAFVNFVFGAIGGVFIGLLSGLATAIASLIIGFIFLLIAGETIGTIIFICSAFFIYKFFLKAIYTKNKI